MNHSYLDPIAAINEPRQDFIRYLLTAYPIKDKNLYQKVKEKLEQPGVVWQHPYLEGSQPYEMAKSIAELVTEDVLHARITDLFPSNRRLYRHQQTAITAVVQQQQNIVVATGTGSGKTECFLVPMVDRLLKEEHGLARSGVRALILYPMNALVNDQVKRLRQILCKQDPKQSLIRFGFYTSRTEKDPKEALDALRLELEGYGRDDLLALFTETEQKQLNLTTNDRLINESVNKIKAVQVLSREEIWENPPHILVTNYSMLEHMLIRPKERREIFEASSNTFNTLILDEAHTYDGSTGTEVAMLLKRFKVAVNQSRNRIRCIATSASLGDASVNDKVLEFASGLFDEDFAQVIRGNRQDAIVRLGQTYNLPDEWEPDLMLDALSVLDIPKPQAALQEWVDELSYLVPEKILQDAEEKSEGDFHRLLWYALKQNPLIQRLINILRQAPQPWSDIVRSTDLWNMELPIGLDGSPDGNAIETAERALARLLQLGTLARENLDDLPLLPVRIHLLFRSLEGIYSCINPQCKEVYLNEKHTCDRCNSPVLELASCAQCGESYAVTQWESKTGKLLPLPRRNAELRKNKSIYTLSLQTPTSRVEEEDNEWENESLEDGIVDDPLTRQFSIEFHDGWIGQPLLEPFTPLVDTQKQKYRLVWHRHKDDKNSDGCYLPKCAACGSRPNRSQAINRFISYTDAPLEAMIDNLFHLLPEPQRQPNEVSKRKLLVFSDSRQDAAFFASDFQRNHTEILYRQMVWEAFQNAKNSSGSASIGKLTGELSNLFVEQPIPHPDRNSQYHHRSYCKKDLVNGLANKQDCEEFAEKRAKELLLREFAVPYARRSSLEAYAMLACHIELDADAAIVQSVASEFKVSLSEARSFLVGLIDIIRRSGIVSIDGASTYFPETGGELQLQRREIIDGRGRSTQVLFLEKNEENRKKSPDSLALLPRLKKNGEPSKAQNRILWYFEQILSTIPSREQLVSLLQELQDSRLLVKGTTGYGFHLNWEMLTVYETEHDWYQCDRCQQVIHVPELSQISDPKLNIYACRAYRCTGALKPYSATQVKERSEQHYQQYLIGNRNRVPLPLRSQEHTAQLGTEELAKRENDFRQGKINLLSCSTTLEMGVDIGELQAVVLRNFPPHVSNYQQRAGRAGRRTDGVALTLMYGQRRPHDRYYFEQPEQLIAGSNQIPRLDPDNLQIQERHIRAELLATFLASQNLGTEQVLIGSFFGLSNEEPSVVAYGQTDVTSMSSQLKTWLYGDIARNLAGQWLDRLQSRDSSQSQELIQRFLDEFDRFISAQLNDWNALVSLVPDLTIEIDALRFKPNDRKVFQYRLDNLLAELKKISRRRLHEQLVQSAILPIYGFPIDVVRLMTGDSNEFKSSKGKHRLERDRRLALSEYAPGQDIVVDDLVHHSVGILRPNDLENKYYWVCKFCNHFESSSNADQTIEECPTCRQSPKTANEQKVHAYRVPKAFMTDWTEKPKVTPYIKPQRQPTSQVFLANAGNPSNSWDVEQICYLTSSRSGQFFLANRGLFSGFCICNKCGRDLAEKVFEHRTTKHKNNRTSSQALTHNHPLTGRECQGRYDVIHLGHEFKSDLLKIAFRNPPKSPAPLFGSIAHMQGDGVIDSVTNDISISSGRGFWYSLTYVLLAAASEVLDIRREELDGLFSPSSDGRAEIVIYDNVPGGAGYSNRIADNFREVIQKAYEIASTCSCQSSCYDCLRTYSNQIFHAELDRHLVAEFLQPIVELLSPDAILHAFARGTNRARLNVIADDLPALFRTTQKLIMYLPKMQDEFQLNHNLPTPWLARLTDAINSARNSGNPVHLLLHQLPKRDSAANRLVRKRLEQWIDQGMLYLFQATEDMLPLLVLENNQSQPIALGLSRTEDASYEWLQTRDSDGAGEVRQKLQKMCTQPIPASDLNDPDTELILPEISWKRLSIKELREKLGLTNCLAGSEICKITYCDRFFYKRGAEIFAKLLESEGITNRTQILVETRENPNEPERKRDLELSLKPLEAHGAKIKVAVYPARTSRLQHARILEIHRADNVVYQIVFDKGIDFLESVDELYSVRESTYMVIQRR